VATEKRQPIVLVGPLEIADDGVRASLQWPVEPVLAIRLTLRSDSSIAELILTTEDGSIGSRMLRDLPIGEMRRAVRAALDQRSEAARSEAQARLESLSARPDLAVAMVGQLEWAGRAAAIASAFVDRPRTGPAGRSDREYAAIAAVYVRHLGDAQPVERAAEQLGLTPKSVRNYLYRARERGVLTSAGRGRAGGELTEYGCQLLEEGD
jgi:hypothetical protein